MNPTYFGPGADVAGEATTVSKMAMTSRSGFNTKRMSGQDVPAEYDSDLVGTGVRQSQYRDEAQTILLEKE